MISIEHTFADLPDRFHQRCAPSSAVRPELLLFNQDLADRLGLPLRDTDDEALAELFSGRKLPEGARPVAMAYAGHQFGNFVPQLGDGRAVLLGEVVAPDGQRFDLHLKGSGPTRFSRGGDGLAWIGPVLREYIVSEAMYALGVPTTRALAAVTTGRTVRRETGLPGATLTRVASSHLRVGTFEYFRARGDVEALRILADYAIERHDPQLVEADDRYLAFFDAVARRTLRLVARWMSVGFVHGVMNTDNTSISGETIDYGPCAFLDTFRFDQVFSSIDRLGRYRYDAQGDIAAWNLAVLADSLLPLIDDDQQKAVDAIGPSVAALRDIFEREWLQTMAPKLGLFDLRPDDRALVMRWLQHLEDAERDFTVAFRELADQLDADTELHAALRARHAEQPQSRAEVVERMNAHNPYIIPRNHQIEAAITDALQDDLSRAERLLDACSMPYEERAASAPFVVPPRPEEVVEQTFCGT